MSIRTDQPSTVGLISLGCAKNQVDSEIMLGELDRQGHRIVTDTADADTVIVNTCGFIDEAKEESIEAILEIAERKARGDVSKLLVAGCMVNRFGQELEAEIPEIDGFADVAPAGRPGDLDGNGVIDGADLTLMLAAWGSDDPVADPAVERRADSRPQQRSSVGLAEPGQSHLGQADQRVSGTLAGVSYREDQHQPLCRHPPRHERKNLRGRLVEPLRVVDDAEHRTLLCEEVQDGQPDQEPVRRGATSVAQCHAEGVLLRVWQRSDAVEQWCAELMQAGECELRLRLHADRRFHPDPR